MWSVLARVSLSLDCPSTAAIADSYVNPIGLIHPRVDFSLRVFIGWLYKCETVDLLGTDEVRRQRFIDSLKAVSDAAVFSREICRSCAKSIIHQWLGGGSAGAMAAGKRRVSPYC